PGPYPLLWPLLGMGAMLAAVMRMPFTSIFFALELTGDSSMLPALLITCMMAYATSVFLMKRSILTEKIARRGLDIFRPYQVDRLEYMPVKDVMTSDMVTVPPGMSVRELADDYFGHDQKFRAYPVVDDAGTLLGVVDRSHVRKWLETDPAGVARLSELLTAAPVVAYPEESCKNVAIRAAVEKLHRIPVVTRDERRLLGMVTRYDLLKPYTHTYDEEILQERVFTRPKRAPKAGE
ncbi:MAG: CBS domain-containing protein, partial [Rhodanobacteraceae bacterium]